MPHKRQMLVFSSRGAIITPLSWLTCSHIYSAARWNTACKVSPWRAGPGVKSKNPCQSPRWYGGFEAWWRLGDVYFVFQRGITFWWNDQMFRIFYSQGLISTHVIAEKYTMSPINIRVLTENLWRNLTLNFWRGPLSKNVTFETVSIM